MDSFALKSLVERLLVEHNGERTFYFEYENEKVWVKTPEYAKATLWHTLSEVFAKILNNHFLRSTVVTDPISSLAYEANKLTFLSAHGIHVPKVLLRHKDYLVLEDCGIALSTLLNHDEISIEEKIIICQKLSARLAQLHNKGLYHSRPALRDITYKEGEIYFIDFEENLENTLTNEEAIIRDGFIFVHALFRKLHTPELISITLESYHRALNPELWDKLVSEGQRYRITYFLIRSLKRYLGKDGIAIFKTLRYLNSF